jgi:hypothetical protein
MAGKRVETRRRKKHAARPRSYPSPWCYPHRDSTVKGVLVGPTKYADAKTGRTGFCLDVLDLDDGEAAVKRIPLSFFGHGFSFHPAAPEKAALFEKRGPGGCYLDLLTLSVLAPIAPMAGHHFYGHGSFSLAGDVLFAVESHLESGDGAISVRDAQSFEVLDTFPTFGARPHDCTLIDRGTVLVITNGGGSVGEAPEPCVTFVDAQSRKLLDKHPVTHPSMNTGHIAITAKHDFAVVSAPRDGLPEAVSLGGVSFRTGKKPMRHMTAPAQVVGRMVGETLSVAIHEASGTVAATTPRGNMVTFWNLYAKSLKKVVDLPDARGVTLTLDDKCFAVAYGDDASLALFDSQSLEAQSPPPGIRAFGGSHLYSWAYPRAA